MQRENYWDYMGRRMREDRFKIRNVSSAETKLLLRIEELNHKVAILGGDPRQLELDV
mgnify:FL=1